MIYPWQQSAWLQLQQQYQQQRLPHALLFTGSAGMGKLAFANHVAEILLCDQGGIDACGQCQSCHWFSVGSHPDFFLLRPEEGSRNIKIDQIRQLISKLQKTPQHSTRQVVIIEPAEAMNTAAANALLKTLEEPSGDVTLMLVSNQWGRLPKTIISRTQRIDLSCHDQAVAQQWLQSELSGSVDAQLLLKIAEYAPLRALGLSDQIVLRNDWLKQLEMLLRRRISVIELAEKYAEQLSEVLVVWQSLLQDVLRLLMHAEQAVVNDDLLAQLQPFTKVMPKAVLAAFLQELQRVQQQVLRGSPLNARLALERLLITQLQRGVVDAH